ncbi:hypothetical protein PUN28_001833 [Cardiocondyla obscurior]|uniref:Uncharacterized protein n=1 Tax=Cardiocondyla obscurior TaxID=286306 RepID=A0AAW2GRK0_9HYME
MRARANVWCAFNAAHQQIEIDLTCNSFIVALEELNFFFTGFSCCKFVIVAYKISFICIESLTITYARRSWWPENRLYPSRRALQDKFMIQRAAETVRLANGCAECGTVASESGVGAHGERTARTV